MKKRTLCISDIHGHNTMFNKLLEKAKYNPDEDQLIILGDLCDRGRENVDTIRNCIRLQQDGAIILMGNHDEMTKDTVRARLGENIGFASFQLHLHNGGRSTYDELCECSQKELMSFNKFFSSLPYYYEDDYFYYVHAGIDHKIPIEENDEAVLTWAREEFYTKPTNLSKQVIFGHSYSIDIYRDNRMDIISPFFFGGDKIGIDCGAYHSGVMGCLIIEGSKCDGVFVQDKARENPTN